ncbi:MAG: hypothetical protein COV10_02970 [Candidatus Vogelbacteria bacterium CG10_big_fil_rev_8_21_14_0_10_51_16]|uniref:Uncharacterized protein n=1 Tax=Candidatus Vogelbacteria bacterium CG10_big_fil_rev_8_21_14_0_10_51_16 TaxID=1975045 RepID=A0A2H0REF6_9BACT|nr:MAG: hypothetical protein COV10_02970 [Candidatus Vogelbacteria bacterium CG10_big_fil_rev_8_21_14_0_10_51_16]
MISEDTQYKQEAIKVIVERVSAPALLTLNKAVGDGARELETETGISRIQAIGVACAFLSKILGEFTYNHELCLLAESCNSDAIKEAALKLEEKAMRRRLNTIAHGND